MRPRAARGSYPYRNHRTMAQVLHADALRRATKTLLIMRLVKLQIERGDLAPKECRPQGTPTADDASGCEGRAADTSPNVEESAPVPDVTIRPAAVRAAKPVRIEPVNARQSRTLPERPTASLLEADRAIPPRVTKPVTPPAAPRPKPPLIDLSTAPSSMELRAASWKGRA